MVATSLSPKPQSVAISAKAVDVLSVQGANGIGCECSGRGSGNPSPFEVLAASRRTSPRPRAHGDFTAAAAWSQSRQHDAALAGVPRPNSAAGGIQFVVGRVRLAPKQQWLTATKMMIRNIPARCTEPELRMYLNTLAVSKYVLEMPTTSLSKCKGYAFVKMDDPHDLMALARELWQKCVPSRVSPRP